MKKKSKKAKPFKAKRVLREKLKQGDRVYIRKDVDDQEIINHAYDSNASHLRADEVGAFRALPFTFLSVSSNKNAYVEFGVLEGWLPRKWLTLNPDRVDPDQIMPDTRDYLESLYLQLV